MKHHFNKTLNTFIMDINQIMASLEAKHPGESESIESQGCHRGIRGWQF